MSTAHTTPPRIALALGGGGARGYAHIGAIEEITSRGWEVVAIAGTSMGAVVGGLYAAGGMDDYAQWARTLSRRDVMRLLDVTVGGPGMFRADRVMSEVRKRTGDVDISDLRIPFVAVAVDLLARQEVWFHRGDLVDAMRASIAIPGVFTPVERDGMLLADGGLLNPVPTMPLAGARADALIAVNLAGPETGRPVNENPGLFQPTLNLPSLPRLKLPARIEPALGQVMARFRKGAAGDEDFDLRTAELAVLEAAEELEHSVTDPSHHVDGALPHPTAVIRRATPGSPAHVEYADLKTMDVIDQSLRVMQDALVRYRIASYPADVMVDIPLDSCGTMDFHRAADMIELGRERTRAALDAWIGQ